MTSINNNVGVPMQAYGVQQKQGNYQTPVNFKAGRDEFVRSDEMSRLMAEQQKEQKKAKKKQKWMSALQVGALISSIALAGFFIWQGTRGRKVQGGSGALKNAGDFDPSNLKFECFKDSKNIGDVRTTKTLSNKVQKFMTELLDSDSISPEYLKQAGFTDEALPNAALLLGPPGTGKTEVVKMFAKASGGDYCQVKLSDFANSYVDGTATQMSAMFNSLEKKAKENPNKTFTIFFDEIDGFARKLGTIDSHNQHLGKNRQSFILGLDQLSKLKNVRIFGATNVDINDVDEAVISRLQKNITFDLPDANQLFEGLKFHTRNVEGLKGKDFDFFKDHEKEIREFLETEMVGKKLSFRDLGQLVAEARKKYANEMQAEKTLKLFDLKYLREALFEKGTTSGELL